MSQPIEQQRAWNDPAQYENCIEIICGNCDSNLLVKSFVDKDGKEISLSDARFKYCFKCGSPSLRLRENETYQSGHIPGPWAITHFGRQVHVTNTNNRVIAVMDNEDEFDRANAALVKSAPELLEACEAALSKLSEMGCECDDNYNHVPGCLIGILQGAINSTKTL